MVVFQKLEGKTTTLKFRNQKLEGKTTTLNFWNQKLEGKTTTLKNWIKRMEGNSTTPKNCVLTNFLHERSIIFLLVFSLIRFWILLRNDYSCLIQSFDFRSRLVKSWEIFANWDWLWLCMPAAGNHEETIKPIQSLLHAISLRHAGAAGSHGVHICTRYIHRVCRRRHCW